MRRPVLVLPTALILTSLTLSTSAQPAGRSGIGLKAGGQWCNLQGSDRDYSFIPGGLLGVYVPLWAGPRFELQPELLLSYQGCDILRPEGDAHKLRMLYLQLPISAKIYLTNELNLQGGLQLERLLTAQFDDEVVTENYRTLSAGYLVGLGVDLRSGLDITARYYGGTTPLLVRTTGVNPRDRSVQLTFGYRIARLSHSRRRRH